MDESVNDVAREDLLRRLQSRGDFLKLLGTAGIGVTAGASLLPGMAKGAVSTSLEPTDFSFHTRERFRPFDLLAKNFVQLDDSFNSNTIGQYKKLRPGDSTEDDGDVAIANGKVRFSGQDGYYTILKSGTEQRAPYATVIVNVASLVGGTAYAGLYKDSANYVHAYYNRRTNTVGLEARVDGGLYELGSMQPEASDFGASFTFAFVANENEVTALVGDSSMDIGNFRPLIKRDVKVETVGALDLRRTGVLATFKNGFGARSATGRTITFERARAGYFGEAGVRDPHVVQYADGTPYIKNNKLYFTVTNAGLGFFEKAHWGVWTMDLHDYTRIEQVGNVFWYNAGEPNTILGHHAGQIVRDEAEGRWIAIASSWGDFGSQGGDGGADGVDNLRKPPVDIIYDELPLSVNLLGGVHILKGRKHPVNTVPYRTEGKWDPGLTRIDGRWYLSYVICTDLFTDFQPALARSPRGADHTDLRFVGADWEKRATEGPIIQRLGGEWRLFASCGDDEPEQFQNRYPIYFLKTANPGTLPADRRLAFDGYLDAPHPTNIPHPMIVPISITSGGRRRTKYIMITFNGDQFFERVLGYGTHGDFYVMQADQTVAGWEFGPR